MIREIRTVFSDSNPNGILLGWDRTRFESELAEICSGFDLVNETDFNYSNCNTYIVEAKNENHEFRETVTFKASYILDIYSIHLTRLSADGRHGNVIPILDCPELVPIVERIRQFIEKLGFQEICQDVSNMVVEGLSLELAEKATVDKCLFDDYE